MGNMKIIKQNYCYANFNFRKNKHFLGILFSETLTELLLIFKRCQWFFETDIDFKFDDCDKILS